MEGKMNLVRQFQVDGIEYAEAYALGLYQNDATKSEFELTAQMFMSRNARFIAQEMDQGQKFWRADSKATRESWSHVNFLKSSSTKQHAIDNGVAIVLARFRKLVEVEKVSKVLRRLSDETDPCIDLVGGNTGVEVFDADGSIKKTTEHFAQTKSFECSIPSMTEYLKYFSSGSVYLLAGTSSAGKTNLALQIFAEKKVLYFGVDMTVPDVVKRIFEIHAYKHSTGSFSEMRQSVAWTWECAKTSFDKIKERMMPLFRTVDLSTITVEEIEQTIQVEIKNKNRPDYVLIDYLGRIETEKRFETEHEKSKFVIRKIKMIAKKLSVPILVLAQYNSNGEEFKTGRINWLAGSRDIMPSVDGIICIWKSEIKSESGQSIADTSHIWVSNALKARQTGYIPDSKVLCRGLYLYESTEQQDLEW
jgi:hypothetical protein